MGLQTFDEKYPNVTWWTWTDSDGTTKHAILYPTAPTGAARLDAVLARTTSESDVLVDFFQAAATEPFLQVTVPAGAGCGTVPPTDLLADLPATMTGGLLTGIATQIKAAPNQALASGKVLSLYAIGGDL